MTYIMGVMSLDITKDSTIIIKADGSDAEDALNAIAEALIVT